ncbi:hypothetical protein JZ751_013063 [Albula glossodonta]|uniref:Protein NATD1 n=1 Tax=Albula glossodonta TaxID=121402 RepID=A0A8T2NTK9_9TELE|nr:hypothetical protein JZ751_013063 [Albula glossodonta]
METAVLKYEYTGEREVNLLTTVVPLAFRGKGVAALLAKSAMDFVVEENLKARVSCWYIKKYIDENPTPEYKDQIGSAGERLEILGSCDQQYSSGCGPGGTGRSGFSSPSMKTEVSDGLLERSISSSVVLGAELMYTSHSCAGESSSMSFCSSLSFTVKQT